jgi:hypothetical protein
MQELNHIQKRVVTVLSRLIEDVKANEDDAQVIADTFDDYLDSLAQDDFFGTEQQMDPRGDFRSGPWFMSQVQGVDSE